MATTGGYTSEKLKERAGKRGRNITLQTELDSRSGSEKRRNRPNRIKSETIKKKQSK
jgi:hypothetical protein